LRHVHLWLGLSLGLVFALLGLTGSALVFYVEIDKALHPAIARTEAASAPSWTSSAWDRALAAGRARWKDAPGKWSFEATGEDGMIPARFYPASRHAGHHAPRWMVWFSADGSRVVRAEPWGSYLMTWLYDLHMDLLAGEPGRQVVGWSGYAVLALLATGLAAWWPRGTWRKAVAFKRGAGPQRRLRDLHKLTGLWSVVLLIVLSATGALLALPEIRTALFAAAIAVPDDVPSPRSAASSGRQIAPSEALLAAHRILPEGRLAFVDVPPAGAEPYRIRVQVPGDPHRRFPGSYVFVDQHDARILAVHDIRRGNAATTAIGWIRVLHDGSVGGLPTRVLAVILGLCPAGLLVTGLLHWRRRTAAGRNEFHGEQILKVPHAAIAACLIATPAFADEAPAGGTITVTAQRDPLKLEQHSDAGSRLDLTVRETPASLETLSQADLQFRGLRTAREAFAEVPGAIAGNVPGNPAVVSMRGFAGNVVSILQDGVRISSSTVVQRDTNTWHFDRIEVIKGPASVLFGEGALGGVINKVTHKPSFDGHHMDALLSYGSFDTLSAAGGVNYQLSDKLALRADASYLHSRSLYDIDDNETRASGLTASLLFRPSDDLSILLAVDHYSDRADSAYQGAVLIPLAYARDPSHAVATGNGMVVDKATRRRNYTPRGGYSGAEDTTVRSRIDLRLGGGWSLGTDLLWYTADRAFVNNGTRTFLAPSTAFPSGSIQRGLTRFYHDHEFWNVRTALDNEGTVAGLRNRFTVGAEYNHTDLASLRETSTSSLVPQVDPFAPILGTFPVDGSQYRASNVNFDSRLRTFSLFAEDALNLTPAWLLVGGFRYDHLDLDRASTDYLVTPSVVTRANPVYRPISWRLGSSYALTPALTLYGQYTNAVSPVSSILLMPLANTRFKLTKGYSYEGGFKLAAFDQRLTVTGAAYRIVQNDIITRDPNDPTLTVQGGTQSSRGVELSLGAAITDRLTLGASMSHADARYDELIEAGGFDRAGNRPVNVPSTTAAANFAYRLAAAPVTLSGFVRHVSGFYTDTANTVLVKGRTTFDAAVSWTITERLTLALRGRNLTDAFYGEYSGYGANDIYIGAPRSVEASLAAHF
jgi:iron complex outermembrane receptor protein